MPNETCAVSASVRDISGRPAAEISVTIVAADYVATLPSAPAKAQRYCEHSTTNDSGTFTIGALDTGSYVIEADDNRTSACLIRCTLEPGDSMKNLGVFSLKSYSTIIGSVDTSRMGSQEQFVQIYGLQRIAQVQPNGFFAIDNLPADTLRVRIVRIDSTLPPVVTVTVQTMPGETTTVFPAWNFSKRVVLNTTSSGANVSGTVHDFPVLIRLTKSNFVFNQAKAGGDDLRFTKSNGAPLPYEVERWDAAAGQAEIWVRVDSLFGNNGAQYITMFWGNPAATRISDGSSVFDTAAGFKAVWHFSQDCIDATSNQMNGVDYGANDTEGVIGKSKLFDGTDSIKIPGPLNGPANITLSAWVKCDKTDTLGGEVISLGDDVLIRVDDPRGPLGTLGSFRYDSTIAGYNQTISGTYLQKTGWRYVTYSIDASGGVQSLYIDGSLSAFTQNKGSIFYHQGTNISIGTHGCFPGEPSSDYTKCHFIGAIDEVRICHVARSPDWIKLCYMNQRADDKLVLFK
jgi:hypothetical protein